jgi:hypothetical protein
LPGVLKGGRRGPRSGSLDVPELLRVLVAHGVEFVIVGGIAIKYHGIEHDTDDLDVLHRRTPENIARVLVALREIHAVYRADPRHLKPRREGLLGEGSHLFCTTKGNLDVLGVIAPGLTYESVVASAFLMVRHGLTFRILPLSVVATSKSAAGRAKDEEVLPKIWRALEAGRPDDG